MADTDMFFSRTGMDRGKVQETVDDALKAADDGELFLEHCRSESFSFDDGRLKAASFDTSQGFGLRSVAGEATGYAHANELSEDAIRRAAETVKAVGAKGHSGALRSRPGANQHAALSRRPIRSAGAEFAVKNQTARRNERLCAGPRFARQPGVLLAHGPASQVIEIVRAGGETWRDTRPLVRIGVSVVVEQDGRQESGYSRRRRPLGLRILPGASGYWQDAIDEALRQALVNLDSVPAPGRRNDGRAWTRMAGILLHEAIGHGLEGDFNRQRSSAFAGMLGKRVAAPGVTVVDDGTLDGRRGSLTIDDEGNPTTRTVLIEDGILHGYMQDRLNARLMGNRADRQWPARKASAHGRCPHDQHRHGGRHGPPAEILASVKKGLYAVNFGGGQVDITYGKFVFSSTEAYGSRTARKARRSRAQP